MQLIIEFIYLVNTVDKVYKSVYVLVLARMTKRV